MVVLVAICTGLSLTADKSLKKTRPTCFLFQCKHSKRRKKRKRKKEVTFARKLQTTVMCHHNLSVPLCCLKVLFKIKPDFISWLGALCSAAKFCYFSDWLKFRPGCAAWQPQLLRSMALALYLQLCVHTSYKCLSCVQ